MNILQRHPKAATAGAILIAVIVVMLLYLLSQLGQTDEPEAGTTESAGEAATNAGAGSTQYGGQAVGGGDGASGDGAGSQGAVPAGVVLSEGQVLENSFDFDIDADGEVELFVLVRGGGDDRPLDWYLVDNGGQVILFQRQGVKQGELAVDGPRVVEAEGVFGPGDPDCCPSSFKRTYYVWRDGALAVSSVQVQPPGAPLT